MTRMRILIAGTTGESMPPPYGGIPKVSLLYAREWKKMGHDVAVCFVYRPQNADDLRANARYFFEYSHKPGKLYKVFFTIAYFLRNPFLYAYLIKEYIRLHPRFLPESVLYASYGVFMNGVMAEFAPDIVIGEAALIKSFMVAKVARMRKIPVVFDTYAEVPDLSMGVNRNLDDAGRKKYWTEFLDLAELTIGICNCAEGALAFQPKEKVKVFYDTCDFTLSRTEFLESREELRRSLKLPLKSFLVGAVGAFEFRKGQHHLIEAVSALAKEGMDVAVALCGGSGDMKKWESLAREQGIADRVHFLQRISEIDLAKFYRSLDLYTNLSNTPRSCGLDLALLEAMASGLPIIVYNNGGLPEAVSEGKNGWIVPTDDVRAVTLSIQHAAKMSAVERQKMGEESAAIAARSDIRLTAEIKLNWLKEIARGYKVG